ncbi:BOS complex subunit NCLN-like [Ambystoma mexicanum]|uniref:BOS complex subunit NCLN-like n=1 Tax=Ambystoma mexicanum TaxID=8296 RepID=UPI0037E81619
MDFRVNESGRRVQPGMAAFMALLVAPAILYPEAARALEFTVYRMQQYTLQGQPHGCRNSLVHAESRTLEADLLTRRCVIMRLADFTLERYREVLGQSAGAMLMLVPQNSSEALQDQNFMEEEMELLTNETMLPIYFALENKDLLTVYEESKAVSKSLRSSSALEVIYGMIMGSGFQMVAGEAQSKPISDSVIVTLEGSLLGQGEAEELPTVVIVAHYDSFGAAPWLSFGADSNGSGVAALLELMRLFHGLYRDSRSRPRYNLLFALTGGGKFNYQGSKRWLEEHLDRAETSLFHDNVAFVMCLDTLANGDSLHLHASKPPKEGTAQWDFMAALQEVMNSPPFQGVNFSMVHKKINLGDELLGWEHEQYSLRRIPAFTISHLDSHRHGLKNSILDRRKQSETRTWQQSFFLLFQVRPDQLQVFQGEQEVQELRLAAILDWLVLQPRAAQLIHKDHPLLSTMEYLLGSYLANVKRHVFKADEREPEFVFYDQLKQTMTSYRVKPAVFDLFVALVIAAYLGIVHQAIQSFSQMYSRFIQVILKPKIK